MAGSITDKDLPFLMALLFSSPKNFPSIDILMQTKDNGFFTVIEQMCLRLSREGFSRFSRLAEYIADDPQRLRRFLSPSCITEYTVSYYNSYFELPFNGAGLLTPRGFDRFPVSSVVEMMENVDKLDPLGHIRLYTDWSELIKFYYYATDRKQVYKMLRIPLHRIISPVQVSTFNAVPKEFFSMLMSYLFLTSSDQNIFAFVLLTILIWETDAIHGKVKFNENPLPVIETALDMIKHLLNNFETSDEFDIFQWVIDKKRKPKKKEVNLDRYLEDPGVELLQFLYYVSTVYFKSDSQQTTLLSILRKRIPEYSDYDFVRTLEILSLDISGRDLICSMLFESGQIERLKNLRLPPEYNKIFSFFTMEERIIYFKRWEEFLPSKSLKLTIDEVVCASSIFKITESPLNKPMILDAPTDEKLNLVLRELIKSCPFLVVRKSTIITLEVAEAVDERNYAMIRGILSFATSLRLHYSTKYSIYITLVKLIICSKRVIRPNASSRHFTKLIQDLSGEDNLVTSLIIAYNITCCRV